MNKNHIVYMHISPNGKRYIGRTSRKAEYRWGNNGNAYKQNKEFTDDINLYGWDNIEHIIVAKGLSEDEARWLETELIRVWDSTSNEKGYNSQKGGKEIEVIDYPLLKKYIKREKYTISEVCNKINLSYSTFNWKIANGVITAEEFKQITILLNLNTEEILSLLKMGR